MTPITAFSNDQLNLYVDALAADLTVAYRSTPITRKARRTVARLLVRVGAWMLPDKPELVSDTVLVLPKQTEQPDVRTAA
ncbi:MAG: hypothetical protein KDB69_00325 [Acidimicrobiia bacterium]|nr:hypothetical protein [Acidimicrobiia bacterium]